MCAYTLILYGPAAVLGALRISLLSRQRAAGHTKIKITEDFPKSKNIIKQKRTINRNNKGVSGQCVIGNLTAGITANTLFDYQVTKDQ